MAFRKENADPDPIKQFELWYEEAQTSPYPEPSAMALATTTADGKPSLRIVLLKEFDVKGLVFYTNYKSRKGMELAVNPWAAATFWWGDQHRQIRVEGQVEKISAAESDDYFNSRARGSNIGAMASQQSQVIDSYDTLCRQFASLESDLKDKTLVRPSHWGGYRLRPTMFEFWQGQPDRLHDRIRYRLIDGRWLMERLAP